MRVLWFTNTPSLASSLLNHSTIAGGWMDSLEKRISERNDVELVVAFQFEQRDAQKLAGEHSTYYIVPHKQSLFQKFSTRHFNLSHDNSDIKHYLRIIEDFKPDIIQVFGSENNFGLVAGMVNIPLIIHIQGILTVCELKWLMTGMTPGYLLKHSSLKKIFLGSSFYHHYVSFKRSSAREKRIFSKCRYFIGRTDWDRRVSAILAPDSEYFHCNEMLRPPFYGYQWKGLNTGQVVLLTTIQGNLYKGLETVMESAAFLKQRMGLKFEWRIAGINSSDSLVPLIEKWTNKKFQDQSVRFLGLLQPEQLIEQMQAASIFIHPSHIDNSPNSVCEAMLLGMPVIATFTGGTGSMLKDKEDGILVQDGDPYALAGTILELSKDMDYAAELGKRARQRALQRHDPDAIVNNLLSIYKDVIKRYHQ